MMFKTYKLKYESTMFQFSVIRKIKIIEVVMFDRVYLLTWAKEWL